MAKQVTTFFILSINSYNSVIARYKFKSSSKSQIKIFFTEMYMESNKVDGIAYQSEHFNVIWFRRSDCNAKIGLTEGSVEL